MKICSISISLGRTFESMGHEVVTISHKGKLGFDLREELQKRNFTPELIFQEEYLAERLLIKGLDAFSCPKIFWSVDTHLNWFWHAYYARLFDGVMTPHVSLLKNIHGIHTPVARLARFGYEIPWTPHSERTHDISFVGRFTEHRPMRKWLADFLTQGYQAHVAQDIPFADMLKLYTQTRIAPNEAIAEEVNFRLMETASCGCMVLSQDIGEDQDALFDPGKEIQTFSDVLELKALLDYFSEHPDLVEKKARAGWERVRKEHLAIHRAQAVLDFAATLSNTAARSYEAAAAFWLSLWNMHKAQRSPASLEDIARGLSMVPQSSEVLAARIGLWGAQRHRDAVHQLTMPVLTDNLHPKDMELNLAGSMAGLFLDDWGLAKQFWYRQGSLDRPETPAHLCQLWATLLRREGVILAPGLSFAPGDHLPGSALECLYLALQLEPNNLEITRQIDALYSKLKGGGFYRLGYLSELSLHNRQNWRYGLNLGLLNLQSFRMQQGLEEILLAFNTALEQGKQKAFLRALAGLDQKGYIKNALDALVAQMRDTNTVSKST